MERIVIEKCQTDDLRGATDEQSGKAIWTCKSQLQVNDGFYVHESKNLTDTIAFLKLRTQIMKELWEVSLVRVLPPRIRRAQSC